MEYCNLCPNACNAERSASAGVCGVSDKLKIAKYYLHPFEEPVLSGKKGSGTVFFCGCSLRCAFCQNYEVSRALRGKEISVRELADIFAELEGRGAHNINLVTPTHYARSVVQALNLYRPHIPVVWNTHGYETEETLRFVAPYVDVYLTDVKFFSPETAKRYCGRENYFAYASRAAEIMCEKPLVFEDGMMVSGTIVRHLVLPQNVGDTLKILDWFTPLKDKAYLSLMSQYTPFGKIGALPELQRKITKREYKKALDHALSLGIENIFVQKTASSGEEYIPEWDY